MLTLPFTFDQFKSMFSAEKILAASGGTVAPPERLHSSMSVIPPRPLISTLRARRTDDTPVAHESSDESDEDDEGEEEEDDDDEDKDQDQNDLGEITKGEDGRSEIEEGVIKRGEDEAGEVKEDEGANTVVEGKGGATTPIKPLVDDGILFTLFSN